MMSLDGDKFRIFSDYSLSSVIDNQRNRISETIRSQTDDYILNVNKEEYLQHLISEFWIFPLEIHKEELSVSTHEAQIPAEYFPKSYHVLPGKSYQRNVIKYHLPFTGDFNLLKIRASTYISSLPLVKVEDSCICFEIINFNLTSDQIKQRAESNINSIETQNQYLTKDLDKFDAQIESFVTRAFDSRKQQILEKDEFISSLGVPVRKSDNTPTTFAVPAKRTKQINSSPKPVVTNKEYKPEPTLDDEIYNQILKIIYDVGKQFERLPSTYAGKDEEQLRDHILLILEPNFEGSATGETFNKTGKTDILLRHEGNNVFIAELKFWRGKKSYLKTISQLISYLTWRDSKAAISIFVKNKEFSPVLQTVKEVTPEHENYLGFIKEEGEGRYFYRFHINGDKNRELKLSIMLFHIPEEN